MGPVRYDEFPPVRIAAEVSNARPLLHPARRPEPAKWLLFAQGRTGSTLFGDLLDSHPDVVFADEILRAHVLFPWLWVTGQRRRHGDKSFGFHVKIYQLTDLQGITQPGRWLQWMHGRGWRILALRRRNLLRHVLSNMAISATGTVHDRSGDAPRAMLTVDPDHARHWMDVRAAVGRAERQALADVPHESFVYEDDLQNPARWSNTVARACGYLGLPAAVPSTTLRRRSPERLQDLVRNYDELEKAFGGTPYATFLDA